MPGFAYLTGLPAKLTHPRRSTPRNRLDKGSVIIGASQAGVMPCTAPSGWHVVGRTDVEMFNVLLTQPCLLKPGDTVQFVAKEVLA
jgi:KipI family sensor histidine kinase inhibitor